MSTTIASSNSNADTVAAALPPPPFNANFESSEEFRATVVAEAHRFVSNGTAFQIRKRAHVSVFRGDKISMPTDEGTLRAILCGTEEPASGESNNVLPFVVLQAKLKLFRGIPLPLTIETSTIALNNQQIIEACCRSPT